MAVQIVPTSRNGNGHAVFPLSRKAFHRSLPGRFGVVEDTLETMERRLDDFICRLTAIEQRPVAVSDPGLEARLDNPSPRIRPGMEGVGKVVVGERKLIWIWTHSLVDWLRLSSWKWLP